MGRDVYAVAEDIFTFDGHIAHVHADTKQHLSMRHGNVSVGPKAGFVLDFVFFD